MEEGRRSASGSAFFLWEGGCGLGRAFRGGRRTWWALGEVVRLGWELEGWEVMVGSKQLVAEPHVNSVCTIYTDP